MPDELPVLDPALLSKLRKLEAVAGAGLVREVIALFLGPLEARLGRLKSSVAAAACGALEEEAHALRGVAAQIGAAQVAACCEQLESAGRNQDLRDAGEVIALLEAAAGRARAALEKEA